MGGNSDALKCVCVHRSSEETLNHSGRTVFSRGAFSLFSTIYQHLSVSLTAKNPLSENANKDSQVFKLRLSVMASTNHHRLLLIVPPQQGSNFQCLLQMVEGNNEWWLMAPVFETVNIHKAASSCNFHKNRMCAYVTPTTCSFAISPWGKGTFRKKFPEMKCYQQPSQSKNQAKNVPCTKFIISANTWNLRKSNARFDGLWPKVSYA